MSTFCFYWVWIKYMKYFFKSLHVLLVHAWGFSGYSCFLLNHLPCQYYYLTTGGRSRTVHKELNFQPKMLKECTKKMSKINLSVDVLIQSIDVNSVSMSDRYQQGKIDTLVSDSFNLIFVL